MLVGIQARLRAPREDDLACLESLRNDRETQQLLMALPRANSTPRVREWLNRMSNDDRTLFFVIADSDDRAAGYLQLTDMDSLHGTAQLGICLSRESRGRGLAVEALGLLERFAHDTFAIRKIILQVLVSNEAAIALYRKLDYRKVGVHRSHWYHAGAFHDVLIMEKIIPASPVANAGLKGTP